MVYVNGKKYRGCVESLHERLNRIIQETDVELEVEEMCERDPEARAVYERYEKG